MDELALKLALADVVKILKSNSINNKNKSQLILN